MGCSHGQPESSEATAVQVDHDATDVAVGIVGQSDLGSGPKYSQQGLLQEIRSIGDGAFEQIGQPEQPSRLGRT